MSDFLFWSISLIDLAAAIVWFMVLSVHLHDWKWRFGIAISIAGLIGQEFRNIYYIIVKTSPTDAEMPFWAAKDAGLLFLAVLFFLAMKGKINWPK